VALTTRIIASVAATLTSAQDLSESSAPLVETKQIDLTSGTGLNQADRVWHDRRTIAASATDSLDMAGSLEDPLGGTFTLAKIKAIYVEAASANTNNVNVTRPAANGVPFMLAAGDGIAVPPNGCFMWVAPTAAGVAVTAGTADLIDVINSGAGTGVTYDIVIIGASA
jgi:hypothetical protein